MLLSLSVVLLLWCLSRTSSGNDCDVLYFLPESFPCPFDMVVLMNAVAMRGWLLRLFCGTAERCVVVSSRIRSGARRRCGWQESQVWRSRSFVIFCMPVDLLSLDGKISVQRWTYVHLGMGRLMILERARSIQAKARAQLV